MGLNPEKTDPIAEGKSLPSQVIRQMTTQVT